MNGAPGSSSTTATSMSLGKGDTYRRINGNSGNGNGIFHGHSNGNGPMVESSNMLISTMATPPGNGRRPADGRGYNKSFWRNLQPRLLWLPL